MTDEPDADAADEPDADGTTDVAPGDASGGADAASPDDDLRERMRRALKQVRREGYKVAAVYAVVDGMVVAMLVTLVLSVLDPAVLDRVAYGDALVAGGVGVLVAGGEFAWRASRPLVERFESVNPEVDEALRTARDTLDDAPIPDSAMVRALYADVLDRLGRASSAGLLDLRRVAGTLVVVLLLSAATVQVTAVGLDLGSPSDASTTPTPTPGGNSTGGGSARYEGLRDGDEVLGDDADVDAGTRNLTANVSGAPSGEGGGGDVRYEAGGYGGGAGSVEAAQAGYAGQERVEDADLIREYNLRIREDDQ